MYIVTVKKIIWFMWFCCVDAILIAYDCKNPATNVTAISLRDVSACPDPENGYEIEEAYAQIIEKKRFEHIHVYSCLIEVTRIIKHCGAFSHESSVEGGLLTYIHEIGAEECRKTHIFKEFRGIRGHAISRLRANATISSSVTLAGNIDEKRNCEPGQYNENGQNWKNVLVQSSIKITLRDYFAKVSLETNEIMLSNGVTCSFLEGYCMDSITGESTWDRISPGECKQYSVLYEGKATYVKEKDPYQQRNRYVVVEEISKVFALQLIRKESICGAFVWQSEHPSLLVFERKNAAEPSQFSLDYGTQQADLISYINTKFMYVEQSLKRNFNTMFAQTVHRRCLLHREILKNRLLLAPLTPNSVASIVKTQLGVVAQVAGEVMYIMKCLPVAVEIRRSNKCYVELPVTFNNKSFFLSPVTRILQEHAEEVECNSIIPPMYYLNNKWIGFDPRPIQGVTPQVLSIDVEVPFKFQSIKDLGSGGLYTYKEIKKAQDAMMFNLERPALNNIIIRKMAGHNVESQGYSALTLFNTEELEEIANSTIRKLYGYFTVLGEWTSGLLGIYFIFRVIKYIIEIFLNAVALHRIGGCSLNLIFSFWDTLTLFILHNKQRKHYTNNKESYARNADHPDDDLREAGTNKIPSAPLEQTVFTTVNVENERPKLQHHLPKNDKTSNYSTLRTTLQTLSPIPEHLTDLSWSMYEKTDHKTTNKK